MRILFHVGVGNTDRPNRWGFVNGIFSDLARGFDKLGHECLLWQHSRANHKNTYKKYRIESDVVKPDIKKFNPDFVFTWNGSSDGDQKVIQLFGEKKMIYTELGFFDHYKTCHIDFSGVNSKSSNLIEPLGNHNLSDPTQMDTYLSLYEQYKKERIHKKPFVFIPLQDEKDTQVTQFSPFKKMDQILEYVNTLYNKVDIDIIYKKHPMSDCQLKKRPKFIEVTENVHHYIPYADMVIGNNSTVLLETYLYHNRVLHLGAGIASRRFLNDDERIKYIIHLYNKQFYWDKLKDVSFIEKSFFYKKMLELYEKSSINNNR